MSAEQMEDRISNVMGLTDAPAPTRAPPAPKAHDVADSNLEEIEELAGEADPDEEQEAPEAPFDGLELDIAGETKRLTKAELKAIAEEHGTLKQTAASLTQQREAVQQERQMAHEIARVAPIVETLRAEGRLLADAMNRTYQEIQSLKDSDPVAAFQKREDLTNMQARFQQLAQQEQQASGYVNTLQMQQMQAEIQSELPVLLAKLPKWSDPEKRKSDTEFIRQHLKAEGYPEFEINALTKSRYVITALKAAKYDAITKARASKKVTDAPPMARPGTVSSPGLQAAASKSEYRKAVSNANSKGNPHAAAKLVERELERRLFK